MQETCLGPLGVQDTRRAVVLFGRLCFLAEGPEHTTACGRAAAGQWQESEPPPLEEQEGRLQGPSDHELEGRSAGAAVHEESGTLSACPELAFREQSGRAKGSESKPPSSLVLHDSPAGATKQQHGSTPDRCTEGAAGLGKAAQAAHGRQSSPNSLTHTTNPETPPGQEGMKLTGGKLSPSWRYSTRVATKQRWAGDGGPQEIQASLAFPELQDGALPSPSVPEHVCSMNANAQRKSTASDGESKAETPSKFTGVGSVARPEYLDGGRETAEPLPAVGTVAGVECGRMGSEGGQIREGESRGTFSSLFRTSSGALLIAEQHVELEPFALVEEESEAVATDTEVISGLGEEWSQDSASSLGHTGPLEQASCPAMKAGESAQEIAGPLLQYHRRPKLFAASPSPGIAPPPEAQAPKGGSSLQLCTSGKLALGPFVAALKGAVERQLRPALEARLKHCTIKLLGSKIAQLTRLEKEEKQQAGRALPSQFRGALEKAAYPFIVQLLNKGSCEGIDLLEAVAGPLWDDPKPPTLAVLEDLLLLCKKALPHRATLAALPLQELSACIDKAALKDKAACSAAVMGALEEQMLLLKRVHFWAQVGYRVKNSAVDALAELLVSIKKGKRAVVHSNHSQNALSKLQTLEQGLPVQLQEQMVAKYERLARKWLADFWEGLAVKLEAAAATTSPSPSKDAHCPALSPSQLFAVCKAAEELETSGRLVGTAADADCIKARLDSLLSNSEGFSLPLPSPSREVKEGPRAGTPGGWRPCPSSKGGNKENLEGRFQEPGSDVEGEGEDEMWEEVLPNTAAGDQDAEKVGSEAGEQGVLAEGPRCMQVKVGAQVKKVLPIDLGMKKLMWERPLCSLEEVALALKDVRAFFGEAAGRYKIARQRFQNTERVPPGWLLVHEEECPPCHLESSSLGCSGGEVNGAIRQAYILLDTGDPSRVLHRCESRLEVTAVMAGAGGLFLAGAGVSRGSRRNTFLEPAELSRIKQLLADDHWEMKTVVRKGGATAGQTDIYYHPPKGRGPQRRLRSFVEVYLWYQNVHGGLGVDMGALEKGSVEPMQVEANARQQGVKRARSTSGHPSMEGPPKESSATQQHLKAAAKCAVGAGGQGAKAIRARKKAAQAVALLHKKRMEIQRRADKPSLQKAALDDFKKAYWKKRASWSDRP